MHDASTLGPLPLRPLRDLEDAGLAEAWATNVAAPLVLTRLVLPALRRAGGAILSITSDAAVEHHPTWGAYGVSKAALEHLKLTLAPATDSVSATRGPVVLHAAVEVDERTWLVELRTAPDARRAVLDAGVGERLRAGPVTLTLLGPRADGGSSPTGQGTRLWRAGTDGDLRAHLDAHGRPIAYGYLDRRHPLRASQTVLGLRPGSAEMASAGWPFTAALVKELVLRGVAVAPVTLHTGVSSQEAGEAPQPERFAVPAATVRVVTATRAGGGRVVAVGTTVTRALESAVGPDGDVVARDGWTERVVTPAGPPRVVTGLIAGWHDPQASHLLLLEAVAGAALVQRAYDAAVAAGYLWHEFGDSALFLPALDR